MEEQEKPLLLSGCAIVDEQSRLLLLYRKDQDHYEFPGGKVKEGESIAAAARREVQEELGVSVLLKQYTGAVTFTNPKTGRLQESHKYLAEIAKGQRPSVMEPEKFDHFLYIPIEEYKSYPLAPNAVEFCERWLRGEYDLERMRGEKRR